MQLYKLKKITRLDILFIFISCFLLLSIGFFNQYPLVTSDTGAYINSGFLIQVPKDRPIAYSIFILIISLHKSLWFIIIFQALLLSYLLNQFLNRFFKYFSFGLKLFIILVTTIFTSVSWYVVQIMPDIFTAILFLASILYLWEEKIVEKVVFSLIIFFSIICHNSNLIISTLFTISFLILCKIFVDLKYKVKMGFYLLLIIVASWLTISLTNFISGKGFTPNSVSHVFIMGKLVENGVLKKYLEEYCPTKQFKLCVYKDQLSGHAWDFIWNNDGPFIKSGGWDSTKIEYNSIIRSMITNPKYLLLNIEESIKATKSQVLLTDVGDGLGPYLGNTNPFWKVQNYFPNEFEEYLHSKQNMNELNFQKVNLLYKYSMLISFLLALIIIIKYKDKFHIYILTILFILFNAFTTATFANVLARLNSRAIWLLFFINLVIIINYLNNYYTNFKIKKSNQAIDNQ